MAKANKKPKKLFVVLNGKKSGDPDLRDAIGHLRKEGHDVQVRVTYEDGDSDRFVGEALEAKSYDVIVAAGGDGSVNEIAGALIKQDAPKETAVAVIPMGTANDFATAAGIPDDPWEALQLAVHDTAYPVDVGLVNDEVCTPVDKIFCVLASNLKLPLPLLGRCLCTFPEVFMNVATGGFGTEITAQTDEGLKNSLGGAAYILTGISKPGAVAARKATGRIPLTALQKKEDEYTKIKIGPDSFAEVKHHKRQHEDVAEFSGDLLVLAVGNSRQAGGGNVLCPDAVMDDGLFDVTYALNVSPDKIPEIMGRLMDAEKSVKDMPEVFGQLRCNWLEVDCPDELQVNRDGEPMRSDKFHFEILPKRFHLHVPNSNLLLKGQGEPPHSSRSRSDSPRSRDQRTFQKKVNTTDRPERKNEGKAKALHIAKTAAKYGAAFSAGGVFGAVALRKGWVPKFRFK